MAANNFYTSEFYLDGKTFRDLSVHFMNSTMRDIMDVGMFLTSVSPEGTVGRPLDPILSHFQKESVPIRLYSFPGKSSVIFL